MSHQLFVLNNTRLRLCTDTQQVEVFDSSTNEWKVAVMINEEQTDPAGLKDNDEGGEVQHSKKRKLEHIIDEDTESTNNSKRVKLSFQALCADLVLQILSFHTYYCLESPEDEVEEPFNIREFFGKYSDGIIRPLYLNIKLDFDFHVINPRFIADHAMVLRQARLIDFDSYAPVEIVNKLHLIAPEVQQVFLRSLDEDADDLNLSNIADKLNLVCIGQKQMKYVPLFINLKTLWLNEISYTGPELEKLIAECKAPNLRFYDLKFEGQYFPLHAVEKNPCIKHFELYNNDYEEYPIRDDDLKNIPSLQSCQLYLNPDRLHLLAENANLEKITLYGIDEKAIRLLETSKSIKYIELYFNKSHFRGLLKLAKAKTSLKLIELVQWTTDESMEHRNGSYELSYVIALMNAFQNSSIEIKQISSV